MDPSTLFIISVASVVGFSTFGCFILVLVENCKKEQRDAELYASITN